MSKKAALACVLFSVMPIESSLADTELKTFRPGDTIRSSEINRNFSNLDEKDEALEDKIDGNYNTLDNRVSTLESSNNSSGGSGGSASASTLTGYDAVDNFQYQYKNIDIGESPPSDVGQKYELVRYDVVSFLTHREIQVSLPAAKFTDDQYAYWTFSAGEIFPTDAQWRQWPHSVSNKRANIGLSVNSVYQFQHYPEDSVASSPTLPQTPWASNITTTLYVSASIELDAKTSISIQFFVSDGCTASATAEGASKCGTFDWGQRDFTPVADEAAILPNRQERNSLIAEVVDMINYVFISD
jgi:hypothetical protein